MLVGMDIGDARGGKNDHCGRFVSVNASLFNSPKYLGVKFKRILMEVMRRDFSRADSKKA